MKKGSKSKKKRRAPGEGSVFEDKRRGGWRGKAVVGRDPETNKLLYKWLHAPTQAELLELKKQTTPDTVGPQMTVSAWSKRWLESLTDKPQTYDEYEVCARLRIVPVLGAMKVSAVTAFDVELAAKRWGAEVGPGTVRKTLAALSSCLQAAHRAELIEKNPVHAARRPPQPKTKIDLFSPAEMLRIIELALTDPRWHVFAVCAATGCRIGEALALQKGDYNPLTKTLHISRTRTRSHGLGTAKSAASVRTIRVPEVIRSVLVTGIATFPYVTALMRWRRFLDQLGLRRRGLHQMKHTVATHAIARGVPIGNVARDLGDTVPVIVRTYLHEMEDGRDVCSAIEGFIGGAEVAREVQSA